jgi:hypothetical protein
VEQEESNGVNTRRDDPHFFLSHSGMDKSSAIQFSRSIEAAFRLEFGRRVVVFNTDEPEHRFKELRSIVRLGDDFAAVTSQYDAELRAYLSEHLSASSAYLLLITRTAVYRATQWLQWEMREATAMAEARHLPFVPCFLGGGYEMLSLGSLPQNVKMRQGVLLDEPDGRRQLVISLNKRLPDKD